MLSGDGIRPWDSATDGDGVVLRSWPVVEVRLVDRVTSLPEDEASSGVALEFVGETGRRGCGTLEKRYCDCTPTNRERSCEVLEGLPEMELHGWD